jgi:NitT/TauT family transport system permease protein
VIAPVLGFLCIVILWELVASYAAKWRPDQAIFLPSPWHVCLTGWNLCKTGSFWSAMLVTNLRVLGGFILAVLVAVPLGVLLGSYPRAESVASPVSNFARYIPVAALVPLLIVWAGVGDLQKILLLAIGTTFQVLVMVSDAINRVPIMHLDSALTLGVSQRRVMLTVLLPAAMPQIYDACRVGIGLTWSYLLLAEIVASENGLGYVIIRGQRFLETDTIFFVIIVLGVLGLVYDRAFTLTRKRLFPWAIEERNV